MTSQWLILVKVAFGRVKGRWKMGDRGWKTGKISLFWLDASDPEKGRKNVRGGG